MLRRQFLASAAALPIVTMLPAGLARAATPRDQFVIATNMTTMRGVDPHEANQIESIEILANLYDRLVFFEPDNLTEPKPQLATAWNVSEDGRRSCAGGRSCHIPVPE